MLKTDRLYLKPWCEYHKEGFAALHSDPEVMADLGGPFTRAAIDAKLDRYRKAFEQTGVARWAVEDTKGTFLGYAGVMPRPDLDHPLGSHFEVGWRLARDAWSQGYATESAQAALHHARQVLQGQEIISYTSSNNLRSQAVMRRLDLRRDLSKDFTASYGDIGEWHGLVWVAPR